MGSKADWEVVPFQIDPDSDESLFFSEHEWKTIEAAASRIIPTDYDPGAREARVIVFIDRYLSGIDFHYAAADGSGFLRMSGKDAVAARARNRDMQRLYREGVRQLDALSREVSGAAFKDAQADVQDKVLERISGSPKPVPISLTSREVFHSRLQGSTDDGMPFFPTLCLHVRQGFYADPVYGGNRDGVGWRVIGFPGPKSLRDTMDGTYSTAEYFVQEYEWEDLIPGFLSTGNNEPSS